MKIIFGSHFILLIGSGACLDRREAVAVHETDGRLKGRP